MLLQLLVTIVFYDTVELGYERPMVLLATPYEIAKIKQSCYFFIELAPMI